MILYPEFCILYLVSCILKLKLLYLTLNFIHFWDPFFLCSIANLHSAQMK